MKEEKLAMSFVRQKNWRSKMKAKLYDIIQTLVDINADFDHRDRIIPKGTEGSIVEC